MIRRLRQYLIKIYPLMEPYTKFYWFYAIMTIIIAPVANIGVVHFTKELFDGVASGDIGKVYFWSGVWAVFIVVALAIMSGQMYIRTMFTVSVNNGLKRRCVDHILSSQRSQLNKYHSGDLMSRLNNDVSRALGLYTNILISLVSNLIIFLGMFTYLLFINPLLVVTALITLPISMMASKALGPKINAIQRAMNKRRSIINVELQDMLKGVQVVRSYRLEERFHNEYMSDRRFIVNKEIERIWVNFLLSLGTNGSATFAQVFSFLVAGILYINGAVSLGSAIMVSYGSNFLRNPLQQIPKLLANMESNIASADRVLEILDIEKEDLELKGTFNVEGDIEFEDVTFGYGDEPVLKNVSFKIPIGERHAFVGPTGAGKSTIARLLLQLYNPEEGEISICGRELGKESIRHLISYVPQEPYLFTGTIRENIGYGRLGASMDEIIDAAKAADAHGFIMELPEGYNSQLGEEGIKLSGGQRQRIAIARAILKDARIFLWDEATSSLDTLSEERVQRMIESLGDKTVILIAHRLSTVKNAHIIHVIQDGRIVESGDHQTLLKANRVYAGLYNTEGL